MKLILLILGLILLIGTASATVTGVSPNLSGDTIIIVNTTWDGEDVELGGDLKVVNSTDRTFFTVINSTVKLPSGDYITMGGVNATNFTLDNSTIFFNSSGGNYVGFPLYYNITTESGFFINSASASDKICNIRLIDSTIKGYDYNHVSDGIRFYSSTHKHDLYTEGLNLSFLGGLYGGTGHYALQLTGIQSNHNAQNITLHWCYKGISAMGTQSISECSSYAGWSSFLGGLYLHNLDMNLSKEGVDFTVDYGIIYDSTFDADSSKFNLMSCSNAICRNNTINNAAFNLGDGQYVHKGNNNTVKNCTTFNTGIGSRMNGTNIINNTMTGGGLDGGTNQPLNIDGNNFTITGNSVDGGGTSLLLEPYSTYTYWTGGHIVSDNTFTGALQGIYIKNQTNNTLTNNTIYSRSASYSPIYIINAIEQIFKDTDIKPGLHYDIKIDNSTDTIFINTNFTEGDIYLVNGADFNNYYYQDVIVQTTGGSPISGATVTFTNEIDNASYPAIDSDGNIQNIFTTGSDGHVSLPIGNRSDSPVLMDYYNNTVNIISMTWQIGADATGYDANNSAITGLNLTSADYRSSPNSPGNAQTIILGGWSHDSNSTYAGQTCTYSTDGSRTCTTPTEGDIVIFTNNIHPVVT